MPESTTTLHSPLPVAGYRPQSDAAIAIVNTNKVLEESVLQVLDLLAREPGIDKRWLAIGRTHIEQGFMAANRAIFQPGRLQAQPPSTPFPDAKPDENKPETDAAAAERAAIARATAARDLDMEQRLQSRIAAAKAADQAKNDELPEAVARQVADAANAGSRPSKSMVEGQESKNGPATVSIAKPDGGDPKKPQPTVIDPAAPPAPPAEPAQS